MIGYEIIGDHFASQFDVEIWVFLNDLHSEKTPPDTSSFINRIEALAFIAVLFLQQSVHKTVGGFLILLC